MSGTGEDALAIARKVEHYSFLLPAASAVAMDKMRSGTIAPFDADDLPQDTPSFLPVPDWPPLTEAQALDRALGCLLGLAVGDALAHGGVQAPPGEPTGVTVAALCLGESLLEDGAVDQNDFMTRLRDWADRGAAPGLDAVTQAALFRFAANGNAAAGSEGDEAGSGSLTRLAPLTILYAGNAEEAEAEAQKQSRATHAALESLDACKLFAAQLLDALDGADKDAATRQRVMSLPPRLLFISAGEWRTKTRAQIATNDDAAAVLEAALWSVWQNEDFAGALRTAASLGGAATSVAAAAGQLAGALYGAAAIPADWLAGLAWRERLEGLADGLFARNRAGR